MDYFSDKANLKIVREREIIFIFIYFVSWQLATPNIHNKIHYYGITSLFDNKIG